MAEQPARLTGPAQSVVHRPEGGPQFLGICSRRHQGPRVGRGIRHLREPPQLPFVGEQSAQRRCVVGDFTILGLRVHLLSVPQRAHTGVLKVLLREERGSR